MSPAERKAGALMFLQSKICCLERNPVVTLLAAVAPRSACELPLVFILVAVHTSCKFDFEFRLLSRGNMAGSAFDGCVRSHRGEAGLCVICNAKRGGAPTLHRMATLATTSVSPL